VLNNKFFVNKLLDAEENYEHALDFTLYFPLGGLLLCLRAITVNPALFTSDDPRQADCIVRSDLM
jgi:hypothetical protein